MIIACSSRRIKALGTRHCFNDIADTAGDHVSTSKLTRIEPVDTHANTVTVEGGAIYGMFGP